MIRWDLFDWQSFSTLATGFAAVASAVAIGLRQADIARRQVTISQRQSEILSRQIDLQEAKLRAELFQRRLETFEATSDFVSHIAVLDNESSQSRDRIERFGYKMRESQFIFSDPHVYAALKVFWAKGNEARIDRAISIDQFEHKEKIDIDRAQRISDVPRWSLETLSNLPELFQRDLQIWPRDGK